MNKNTDGCIGIRILSPLTGTAVPLEEVPDPVFSQKIIGDGVAILPQDGNLVSPIDAEVVSIAETLHAYGLRSENGIEVMIHFGLETVALKGECFQCCVKVGDKVKAGSLLGYMGDSGYGKQENTVGNFAVHLHLGIYIRTDHYEELSVNPYWILKYLEKYKLKYNY